MHYTTSCKHNLVLLRMGEIIARNMLSQLKSLIKLFLHLVGCLYYCINDARSHKHEIIICSDNSSKLTFHSKETSSKSNTGNVCYQPVRDLSSSFKDYYTQRNNSPCHSAWAKFCPFIYAEENRRRALVGGCCGDHLDPGRSNEEL